MTGSTELPSHSDPIDNKSVTEESYRHSDALDRPKLLRLALQFSVLEMSEQPGVPTAHVIYSALASDAAFEREFAKANTVHKQGLRAEVADLLTRSRKVDLSRIFIALSKLRKQTCPVGGESTASYDYGSLSDEDLSQLISIMSKIAPQPAQTADTNQGGGNDEHKTKHP